jgi:hypothetical protein
LRKVLLGSIRQLQQSVDVRHELRRMSSVPGVTDDLPKVHRCVSRLKHFLVFLRDRLSNSESRHARLFACAASRRYQSATSSEDGLSAPRAPTA